MRYILGLTFLVVAVMVTAMVPQYQIGRTGTTGTHKWGRGICGPPDYTCVSRSPDPLAPLTSPVDSSTPFNTTWHSAINPTSDCYTLLADSNLTGIAKNTSVNQTLALVSGGNNTWSLGANDHMGSLNNTYWGIARNGGAYIYHLTTANVSGSTCVQNISPFGGQGAGIWFSGALTFSSITENVLYRLPNSSGNHLLTKEVLNSDATDSTSTTVFDFDNCPGMTPGASFGASTQLGVSVGDTRFATALSPGNQGFGHNVLVYQPGTGCYNWDTANGNIWLPTDTSTPSLHETACTTPDYATGSGVHGTQITGNGKVMQISGACWVGFGGAAIGGSNVAYWEVGTANVIGFKDQPPANDYMSTNTALNRGTFSTAGHDSVSAFHTMVGHNPTPNSRVIFPLNETNMTNFTTLFDFGGGPDSHGGHPLQDLADTYPWIWGSMGTSGTLYNREIYGIGPTNGPLIRFGPQYNTGSTGAGCGTSILAIAQNGKMVVFLTDMLGSIATCAPVAMVLGN
jgi:hypothetical protein